MTAEKSQTPETKRARRKLGANSSQLWPQMPKVQNPTARANAYLKVAGLSTKLSAPPLDPKLDLMNSPEIKFGRLLASPEQRVRHEAVRRLNQYLTARCVVGNDEGVGLSELDLLKLWKGLWFTLYMADRVPVQDELSKQLAQMIWCVAGTEEEDEYAGKTYLDMYGADDDDDDDDDPEVIMEEIVNTTGHVYDDDDEEGDEDGDDDSDDDDDEQDDEGEEGDHDDHDHDENGNCIGDEDDVDDSLIPHCRGAHLAALFVKTFFQTVRREWGRMDKYRVDKFYTLIRLMMEQVYEYMAKRHWNLGIVRLFNDVIYDEVLSQTPNGLRLHIIDLSLDELAKVNASAPMPLTEATFVDVLEPFFAMSQACKDKIVQARVMEKVLHGFLEKFSVISEPALDETEEQNKSLILNEVHVGTVADFIFALGSDPDTRNEYRKSLYATYKDYKRRLAQVGKDVVLEQDGDAGEDEMEEDEDDDDDDRVIEVDDPANFVDDDIVEIAADEPPPKTAKTKAKKQKGNVVVEATTDLKVEKDSQKKGSKPIEAKSVSKVEKGIKNRKLVSAEKNDNSVKKGKQVESTAAGENVENKIDKGGKKRGHAAIEDNGEIKADTKAPKKKWKAKDDNVAQANPELMVADTPKETKSSKKAKRKKNKKSRDTTDEDEVITISVADQKRAKDSTVVKGTVAEDDEIQEEPMKDKRKKKRNETEEEKEARRVSFGKVNHSKSHKASMKALRTMPAPKLVPVTPEKSILLKKSAGPVTTPKNEGKNKKGRKKAADYF